MESVMVTVLITKAQWNTMSKLSGTNSPSYKNPFLVRQQLQEQVTKKCLLLATS